MNYEPFTSPSIGSRIFQRVKAATALLCLATSVGCGSGDGIARLPVHPVEGAITARGQTDESGKSQVTTYDSNDGAPEGEYAVTVQYYELLQNGTSSEPGPNVLNPKISSPHQTDVVVKVASGANKLPAIEVERR